MHIAPDDVEASIVRPKHPHSHVHAKSGVVGSGKVAEDNSTRLPSKPAMWTRRVKAYKSSCPKSSGSSSTRSDVSSRSIGEIWCPPRVLSQAGMR